MKGKRLGNNNWGSLLSTLKKNFDTLNHSTSNTCTNPINRIDTDELKTLLRKHNSAFTEEEICAIGEMYYAGKSGGSVSFDRFIEAIDRVVQREENPGADASNPMEIGSCGNEYLFYKSRGNYKEEDLNIKLTHNEPQTIRDKIAFYAVKGVRSGFDKITGWNYGNITPHTILQRVIL
jgi:hypothetical protein